jgi:hypothetical protein
MELLLGERSPSYQLRLADNIGERVTRGWISLARRVLQSDHVLPPRSKEPGKARSRGLRAYAPSWAAPPIGGPIQPTSMGVALDGSAMA